MRAFPSRYLSWLVVLLALPSCAQLKPGHVKTEACQLPISVLANLPRGISLDELTKITGIEPQHQFTARTETNDIQCVTLSFERPRGRFHFLFRNGGLASIQNSPSVEFVTRTNHGVRAQQPKPVHPEAQMNKVIHGRDLSSDEIIEWIEALALGEAQTAKGREPMNILPAFVLVSPLILAESPARGRAAREAGRLAEKFDPFKIQLEMTADEAKAVFGFPEHQHNVSTNCIWRCYGSTLSGRLSVHVPHVWVSVVFWDGKATRVFSHDFYHNGPLESLQ